jgi:elongation factor P
MANDTGSNLLGKALAAPGSAPIRNAVGKTTWIPAFAGMTREKMKANEIKKGNVVEYNNTVYQVRDIERSAAQGRSGNITFRFIMYSIPGGTKYDLSLRSEDELKEVELNRREATYSYKDGDAFVFMDTEDYSQYTLDANVVGDAAGYITDGLAGCYVQIIDDLPVALQLPASVVLEVIETPPELKGGTATKRPKPARLSTGIEIQVPEYIGTGEKIYVSTVTGEFGGRV